MGTLGDSLDVRKAHENCRGPLKGPPRILLSQGSGISAIACGKKSIKTIKSRLIAIQIQLGGLRLAMNGVVDGSSTSIT